MNKLFNKQNIVYLVLGAILLLHILILTELIYFPYPELFIYPYLTNHGLRPYSQILDQHFPGLLFLPINFDNLGLNTPNTARLWSIAIVIIIHGMLFLVGSRMLKSRSKALLVNFLFLIWNPFFEGWVLWIDSFLPLMLLPAFYSLYKNKFFIGGLLLGLGIIFKQTVIPLSFLSLIYVFLVSRSIRLSLMFLLGLFIPIILMLIYLTGIGVLSDFWYWTIVFNLTTYAQTGTKAPPSVGFVTRVLLVYAASLPALWDKNKRLVYLLFIFIVGLLIGAFERGDFVHFQPSVSFAILATVIGFNNLWKRKIMLIGAFVYMLITIWWLTIFYKGHLSNTILLFDSQTEVTAFKIRQYAHPGEKVFVFGAPQHLYQMSDTLPAGNIFVFQFPWFLHIAGDRILEGIIKDKPGIIIYDKTFIIEGAKITDFASNIDRYIGEHYSRIDSIGTTQILRKKS